MNQSPTSLREAIARLGDALCDVAREVIGDDALRRMTDVDVLELARVLEAVGRPADALRAVIAGEIDDRSRPDRGDARLSAQHGCANAVELLTRATGIGGSTAKDRVRLARHISPATALTGETLSARFPALRDALAHGTVGVDSALAVIRVLGPISDRVDPIKLAAAETELVAAAAGVDDAPPVAADETILQARVWELVLDPDGTLPEYERALRKRGVTLGRKVDGLRPLRGWVLDDVGEQLQRLFDAYLSPRVEDRTSRGSGPTFVDDGHIDNGGPVVPTDIRSRAQKQHDVLASVLQVAARAAETPTLGGAAPALMVTAEASELNKADGVAFVDGTDCTIPAFVARQIACCGGVQRVVFGENGRIIELGTPQRTFTPHQRRAIMARDGGCIIPGCHVPGWACEVHHAAPWARGGPTHTDNGLMLCWWHHRSLEFSGWQVRMVGGIPQTKAPYEMDPYVKWRPATGSMHRQWHRLREAVANE